MVLNTLLTAAPGNGTSASIYGIIAVLLLAAPAVMWLGLRLYAAMAAAVCCRGCVRRSEGERRERCPLSAGVLDELEKSGRNIRWALIILLIVLLGWWLLSAAEVQILAINGIGLGALVCCILIVFAALTRLIAALALPASLPCRAQVIKTFKKSGSGFGWLVLAYVIVHILLTV